MDPAVVEQLGLTPEPLPRNLETRAIDGRLLATITHQKPPIRLTFASNHQETIQFKILFTLDTPLVLGHSWLVQHNPVLDWTTATITRWSPICATTCLLAGLSSTPPSASPPPEPPSLSSSLLTTMIYTLFSAITLPLAPFTLTL